MGCWRAGFPVENGSECRALAKGFPWNRRGHWCFCEKPVEFLDAPLVAGIGMRIFSHFFERQQGSLSSFATFRDRVIQAEVSLFESLCTGILVAGIIRRAGEFLRIRIKIRNESWRLYSATGGLR